MEINPDFQTVRDLLQPWAVSLNAPESNRLDVVIETDHLLEAAKALLDARWGYLSAITGMDRPAQQPKPLPAKPGEPPTAVEAPIPPEGHFEALYHYCNGPLILTLRINLPAAAPKLPSICGLIPSATLYERELIEMFGFYVDGTPDPGHFILPEDWPDGVYPLRKNFHGLKPANQA